MGLYLGGLIIQRILRQRFGGGGGGVFSGGVIFGVAYYGNFTVFTLLHHSCKKQKNKKNKKKTKNKNKKQKKNQQICSLTRKEHPTNIANTYP